MKAVVCKRYGSPEVLQLKEVEKPAPKDKELLIKIHVTTVNRTDCAILGAKPFFARLITGVFKPKRQIPGTEFAGEIEALGKDVTSFNIGDRVFGFDDSGVGSHAQYMTISQDKAVTTIPGDITYAQAAASTEGAHYAINFINKVNLRKGHKVLVNGATGAIGSAAVQLLNYYDAQIAAVCKGEHFELVEALGAKDVIDYTQEDFTKGDQKYDYVFDTVGKSSFFKCRHLIQPQGAYISSDLGYLSQNIFLPLITPIIKPLIGNKKTIFPFPSNLRGSVLLVKQLMEEGKFKAVIDREYLLEQVVEAFTYVEKGQKIGNVAITVEHDE